MEREEVSGSEAVGSSPVAAAAWVAGYKWGEGNTKVAGSPPVAAAGMEVRGITIALLKARSLRVVAVSGKTCREDDPGIGGDGSRMVACASVLLSFQNTTRSAPMTRGCRRLCLMMNDRQSARVAGVRSFAIQAEATRVPSLFQPGHAE